jgi:2-dehydro-3-deoxyphosphogluconate aldolase / (4S)-4-hydroxy-2-oxoglutarate aldolase
VRELQDRLRQHRLLAILRGVPASQAPRLVEVLHAAGLRLFEVALSEPGGLDALRAVRQAFGAGLALGAGTVVGVPLAEQAQAAGADFLVTPHLVPAVAAYARAQGLGLLSGALTPTEIMAALEQGSAAVKVFPAGALGPDYFRQLRGPYPDVPLLAVGGVDQHNLAAYLQAGALGAGIGGALTRSDWTRPDWAALAAVARQLVETAEAP